MLDVALASCAVLPEPDPDQGPLTSALAAAGIQAAVLAWDDPAADFASARLTVLRSTWNYSEQRDAFLAWAQHVAARTALWNPMTTLRWNTHKTYLLDLAARGIPTVPTHLATRGDETPLGATMSAHGWAEVVIKPAVSAGSRATMRVRPGEIEQGEAHLSRLLAREDALVQPFMASVEGYGERSLVFIDGEPTHAVRKSPRFLGDPESVSDAVPFTADEAELGKLAMAAAPDPLLYGRVDLARGPDGAPRVMELELVEPSLFFRQSPAALARFVGAVAARLASARSER